MCQQYTQQEASKLGLKGWCMNTENGTVQGVIQGDLDKVNEMFVYALGIFHRYLMTMLS